MIAYRQLPFLLGNTADLPSHFLIHLVWLLVPL